MFLISYRRANVVDDSHMNRLPSHAISIVEHKRDSCVVAL
jgi:hypothetical protein